MAPPATRPEDRLVVCVAGMHRSGTSMIAGMLAAAGLDVGGSSDLIEADRDNPAGYWEHRDFVALNNDLLASAGGGWDHPPPWPTHWSAGDRFPELWDRGQALAGSFTSARWGWKDPRTSLTATFWRELLPDLRIVVAVRNPLEVAASLQTRNQFSPALSFHLWLTHYERLLGAVPRHDRLVTAYEDVLASPAKELRRLTAFAGLAHDERALAEVAHRGDDSLRHHRFAAEDIDAALVPAAVRSLYDELRDEAGDDVDVSASTAVHP